MNEIVVLHISDLHFGIENDKSKKTKYVRLRQREMIESLINTIKDIVNQTQDWTPNVIVISGDIGWSGKKEEYQLYKDFFVTPIYEVLGIPEKYIITCPGNHDIIREKVNRISRYQKDVKERDGDVPDLNREEIKEQAIFFENYVNELCEGKTDGICKSITFQEWPWVTFLTLNSAWDCRKGDDDEGRLRVGLPILEDLIGNIPHGNCIITIFHHPHTEVEDVVEEKDGFNVIKRQWLHISEREPDIMGERTFASYVEEKSTYILNGHIHREIEPQKLGKATRLISGTIYSNDTPRYHCRLLKIKNNGEPLYRDIRHRIGDTDENWEVTIPKHFQFEHIFDRKWRETEQIEKEFLLGKHLEEAMKKFEEEHDFNQYNKVIKEIIRELLHESIAASDVLNQENYVVLDKNMKLNGVHTFTLKNGGEV